jgi:hypothetical protein
MVKRERERRKRKGDKLPSFFQHTQSQLIQLKKTEEIIILAQLDVLMAKSMLYKHKMKFAFMNN